MFCYSQGEHITGRMQQTKLIVVEREELERILTKIVSANQQQFVEEIKGLLHRKENPLDGNRITVKQLMKEFGVTRNTIQNYRKNGQLPIPNHDLSGRPYWTPKQLEGFFNQRKARRKFPV